MPAHGEILGDPLLIDDHKGEPRPYRVVCIASPLYRFCCDFTRLDTGKTYRTGADRLGSLRCNCDDFYFRRKKQSRELCKHLTALLDNAEAWGAVAKGIAI